MNSGESKPPLDASTSACPTSAVSEAIGLSFAECQRRRIPERLLDIASWLARKKVKLVAGNENQRIDSVKNHSLILHELSSQRQFQITPHGRPSSGWFSFELGFESRRLPVKIKVSSFSRADNLNCKLGVYHALTGQRPEFADELAWERYFQLLKHNLDPESNEDFYFLVVNRTDTSDVFCNSLKGIEHLRPNGSNLPFQCNWDDNRNPCRRSNSAATQYILDTLRQSARLRAEMFHGYEKYFG
jgi:hypothetical protein